MTNKAALEVSQQWAGHPGGLAASSAENFTTHEGTTTITTFPVWQVWRKPLQPRQGKQAEAVLVINLSEQPQNVTLASDGVTATDVWTGEGVSVGSKSTVFDLAPHASRFLVLVAV